jgi:glycosyltransferase involved in cell wall biosynthesis
VLVAGLRELGLPVEERHRPVWERERHKLGLGARRAARSVLRYARAWGGLAREVAPRPPAAALVAGYPAQPDVLPAWLAARRLGVPLVVDLMISLWDTLAGDRGRVGAVAGRALLALDRAAVRAGDLVLADTRASAEFIVARLGAAPDRVAVVPVGAEPERFPARPLPDGPVRALFYGKLSPLHGVDTLLAAARRPGVPPLRLVGDGQLGPWLDRELRRDPLPGVERVRWVPYECLGEEIAAAAVCLGIFGTSEKAARVVPNKVYQAMAAGRAVVTADTPAAREVLTDGVDALLVPPGDPEALARALRRLAADRSLCARIGAAARGGCAVVGAPRAVAGQLVDALARSFPSRFSA